VGHTGTAALALATAAAAITGYASIAWLLRFLRTRSLLGFALYRVFVGGLVILMLLLD